MTHECAAPMPVARCFDQCVCGVAGITYTEQMCCDTHSVHVPPFCPLSPPTEREKTTSRDKDGQQAYRSTRALCTVTNRLWE